MTDLTTAARLALDALTYHTAQTRPITSTDEAIDALCAALAAPPSKAPPGLVIESHNERWTGADEDGDPIREVGPMTCRPVSEPRVEPYQTRVICPKCCHQFRAIPTQVQSLLLGAGFEPPFLGHQISEPRQEPVAHIDGGIIMFCGDAPPADGPLYTRPSPAMEPLTLTDEQIFAVRDSFGSQPVMLLAFARAVLAAAGEAK